VLQLKERTVDNFYERIASGEMRELREDLNARQQRVFFKYGSSSWNAKSSLSGGSTTTSI
jgi:hypothetical protein